MNRKRIISIRILRFNKKADGHNIEFEKEVELSGKDILEILGDGFKTEFGA